MNRRRQLVFGLAAAACTAISIVHLFAIHAEYYGSGPPYYGRTTNMDKWQSPTVDNSVSALVAALGVCSIVMVVRSRKS